MQYLIIAHCHKNGYDCSLVAIQYIMFVNEWPSSNSFKVFDSSQLYNPMFICITHIAPKSQNANMIPGTNQQ